MYIDRTLNITPSYWLIRLVNYISFIVLFIIYRLSFIVNRISFIVYFLSRIVYRSSSIESIDWSIALVCFRLDFNHSTKYYLLETFFFLKHHRSSVGVLSYYKYYINTATLSGWIFRKVVWISFIAHRLPAIYHRCIVWRLFSPSIYRLSAIYDRFLPSIDC